MNPYIAYLLKYTLSTLKTPQGIENSKNSYFLGLQGGLGVIAGTENNLKRLVMQETLYLLYPIV